MKVIQTDKAPAAIGPYSQGYISNGLFFTSAKFTRHIMRDSSSVGRA